MGDVVVFRDRGGVKARGAVDANGGCVRSFAGGGSGAFAGCFGGGDNVRIRVPFSLRTLAVSLFGGVLLLVSTMLIPPMHVFVGSGNGCLLFG